MRDPDEELRRIERELERVERSTALEPRSQDAGALRTIGGVGRATLAVGTVVLGLVAVGIVLRMLPLLIFAGLVYGVYRLFYAPDRRA